MPRLSRVLMQPMKYSLVAAFTHSCFLPGKWIPFLVSIISGVGSIGGKEFVGGPFNITWICKISLCHVCKRWSLCSCSEGHTGKYLGNVRPAMRHLPFIMSWWIAQDGDAKLKSIFVPRLFPKLMVLLFPVQAIVMNAAQSPVTSDWGAWLSIVLDVNDGANIVNCPMLTPFVHLLALGAELSSFP